MATANLEFLGTRTRPTDDGLEIDFETNHGNFRGEYYEAVDGAPAIVWLTGERQPANCLYRRLANQLLPEAASLILELRTAQSVADGVVDTLMGLAWLASRHVRCALVGYSGSACVAIETAAISSTVSGVAALSPLARECDTIRDLGGRPVLLVHGEADPVSSYLASVSLYHAADEPRQLRTYPGAMHGLEECRSALDRDLLRWLRTTLRVERQPAALAG
jgi:dienelactone hydrolase